MAVNKKAIFRVKGMTRDLAVSKFNSEHAYEIKNMRLWATDDSTSLSLINEKGTLDTGIEIQGMPVGQAVINDKLILFTAKDIQDPSDNYDRIYKLEFNDSSLLTNTKLYEGNLGFDTSYPIESISIYEKDNLEKIYWVDGLNQPRVINISSPSDIRSTWNDDTFNFVRKLTLKENIKIEKNITVGGVFAPGVIQYCFTYFDFNGQESNIFYTSPIYYTSHNDRGASPE